MCDVVVGQVEGYRNGQQFCMHNILSSEEFVGVLGVAGKW